MPPPAAALTWFSIATIAVAAAAVASSTVEGIGVNWGTQMSHPMLPTTVVRMLKANGISQVKLFDADAWTVGALAGTGIEVMLAIPNDQLARMSSSYDNAKKWVKENVTRYDHDGGVNIKYVAVGNEPFLKSYNGSFLNTTFPALKNVQKALDEAGVGNRIKTTVPLNADVYSSPDNDPVPSAGNFRSDIRELMVQIVRFLHDHNAPFVVNIYPFLSLYQNRGFPVDFAFFDGGGPTIDDKEAHYTNVFDANYDTLAWSLKKAGVPNMPIIVGEVGWPTDGDKNANVIYAKRFYDGFFRKMAKKEGTPLRPGKIDVYLFGLIDEDMKSVLPGDFERHWGLFTYDGKPKFPMDLSGQGHDKYLVGATGVEYLPAQWCVFNRDAKDLSSLDGDMEFACSSGDCTALVPGSSCNGLDKSGKISYAFNMYFQMQDQDVRACDFGGLAKITTKNASQNGCLFPVQILSAGVKTSAAGAAAAAAAIGMTLLLLL
ncbi:glucan endo-1,3-beta-glucosidase 8-like [Ananas comosus]|uniref:glucan endo-1,3-beta-D-glucosidase n=2 Tax=Ananas comosus TaxID=4615 RepID=A0A6P5EY29_ANACO|nr:glucan endo-1,3-beta-glucosidase 8-like [Ananas comosus]